MSRRLAFPLAASLLLGAAAGHAQGLSTATEHVVAPGDTLSGIASKAGVPMVVIAEANGLSQPYPIRAGQKLVIPRQSMHEVKRGDTGFGIAYQYGVPFSQIALANGIAEDSVLQIGQKLIIPAMIPAATPTATIATSPATPAPASTPAPSVAAAKDPAFRRPHEGPLLLGWKRRPDGGGHEGLDFKVKVGDAVRATAAGTVIFAGDEPERFGRLVVIDHGNGWHSAYGHLSRVTVKKDETVRAGERIGLGGDAGVATQPELHFELRQNNKPVDPAARLGIKTTP